MKYLSSVIIVILVGSFARAEAERKTVVEIRGRAFFINGKPTYAGRVYKGMKIEGLLMNSRMVQGIFDDRNPETRELWKYPDGPWDPERNTREFVAAMPSWRAAGLLSVTLNLQGGNPRGYSADQPWYNSAFEPDGSLRADYLARLEKILDKADELGMVPILGYFYFGQAYKFRDEQAIIKAAENATDWLISKGYRNVMIEIANETNHGSYKHGIFREKRADELIKSVRARSKGRLLVSTSFTGGALPPENVAAAADFLLLHGNGVGDPNRIRRMVDQTRALKGYHNQPILFNEDDHFGFDRADNNFVAAVSRYASWGYFDYRMKGEGFEEGYQSVPAEWGIGSGRKRGFFQMVREMAGGAP